MIPAPPDPSLPPSYRALAFTVCLILLHAHPAGAQDSSHTRRWVTAATVYNLGVTWDFETGDLRGWTPSGHAFDRQPTFGDNPTARNRGQPANQQGNYWIGTYELYQKGDPDERPGGIRGDGAMGSLTSPDFKAATDSVSFLIGGGNSDKTGVELLEVVDLIDVAERRVAFATGENNETMRRVAWDLKPFAGKTMRIRIIDNSSEGWGHVNADDFHFFNATAPPPPTDAIVPDVMGRDMTRASSLLDDAGLVVGHVDSVESDQPAGLVVRQDPQAQSRAPRGSPVALEVARTRPPDSTTVPNVVGRSLARAVTLITGAKLHIGLVDTVSADTLAPGVVQQFPAAGSKLPHASHVDLLLAVSPTARVQVPSVIGERLAAARRRLKSAALGVGKVTGGGAGSDRVVQTQMPRAGDSVPVGGRVDLTLGASPRPIVAVPDLHGLELTAAESVLAHTGLKRSALTWVESHSDSGTVVDQNPASHVLVARGSSVQLYLALPAPSRPDWWTRVAIILGLGLAVTAVYQLLKPRPDSPPDDSQRSQHTSVGANAGKTVGDPEFESTVPSAPDFEVGFRPGADAGDQVVERWSSIEERRENG
jgi:beta-lactam-binding protein with PASTA domain